MMRGIVALVLVSGAIAFSHVIVLSAVLALAAGAAVIWVTHHYRHH